MSSDTYAALPVFDIEEEETEEAPAEIEIKEQHLTTSEKIRIARPLLVRYMLPLFFVYLAGTSDCCREARRSSRFDLVEYTINTGVAPTLIYPIPDPKVQPLLADIIKSLRDYYPFVVVVVYFSGFD